MQARTSKGYSHDQRESASHKSVLFVDDEPLARKYFAQSIEPYCEVFVAASAAEALDVMRNRGEEIGLVIADERMPGESGIQFLASIRQRWPNVRRMLTTAYADIEKLAAAINLAEIHRYIAKPWSVVDLRQTILNDLGVKSESSEIADEVVSSNQRTESPLASIFSYELSALLRNIHLGALEISSILLAADMRSKSLNVRKPLPPDVLSVFERATAAVTQVRKDVQLAQTLECVFTALIETTTGRQGELKTIVVRSSVDRALTFLSLDKPVSKKITIEILEDVLISGLEPLLQVMIAHLIQNGLDAIGEKPDGRVWIGSSCDDIHAEIRVIDNGPSVDPELFDGLFYHARSTKQGGLGVGLALCRIGMQIIGGEIAYRPSKGTGSEFVLVFPKCRIAQ